eukprot:gnl/TRDRNA2_/TRDRNA2_146486_c0_seq3.p1 gnl/TRDRNA2_/TRDRNA2_146486_c0~~gnl/TRDRNA2_/TRDRNA2_146486_c0_seq3.p1  ORF type:complete len:389 (+),score=46.31 gnl/TRDRNA2_/TRDRNA2_146486_c0_seq3:52-1167(+)
MQSQRSSDPGPHMQLMDILPTAARRDIGPHDLGGLLSAYGPIDTSHHQPCHWELEIHATLVLSLAKGQMSVHELRRGIESMDPELYAATGYYEKWAVSIAKILLEKGKLSQTALDAELGVSGKQASKPVFKTGDAVRVRAEDTNMRWRRPHLRTPGYIFGVEGVVERFCGAFEDPMLAAFGGPRHAEPLYRVRFQQCKLWPEFSGANSDTVDVEVYQNWLEAASADGPLPPPVPPAYKDSCPIRWDGAWVRVHKGRSDVERKACEKESPSARLQPFAEGLVQTLLKIGFFSHEELRSTMDRIAPSFQDGAAGLGRQLVARAWLDSEFRANLLKDASVALSDAGVPGPQGPGTILVALENTEAQWGAPCLDY